MAPAVRFRYVPADQAPATLMPRLPLPLHSGERSVEVVGILDTGSAINVLPYPIGLALGAVWEAQSIIVPLVGSLGSVEARALIVTATYAQLTSDVPVRLVFAWTRAEDMPVIFGQINFFLAFDVCFYRAQEIFEVRPR